MQPEGGEPMTGTKIALSIEEAADYTGIGRNTLRNLVEWGKLPVLKVGRKVLIKSDILEKFMEVNEGKNLRDKNDVKSVTRKLAI
jgi:excisionase family DNA binding protein